MELRKDEWMYDVTHDHPQSAQPSQHMADERNSQASEGSPEDPPPHSSGLRGEGVGRVLGGSWK